MKGKQKRRNHQESLKAEKHLLDTFPKRFSISTDYLLTSFVNGTSFVTGKYLLEVCAEKTESKYFIVQTEQTRLIRNLL